MLIDGEEFSLVRHPLWTNLIIPEGLGQLQKLLALIEKLAAAGSRIELTNFDHVNWLYNKLKSSYQCVVLDDQPMEIRIFSDDQLTVISSKQQPESLIWYLDHEKKNPLYLSGFLSRIEPYYIDGKICRYDNLIHLLIMVKDAGDQFAKMLKDNLSLIDFWTILDTGSTDQTVETVQQVLKGVPGQLYQEPFIDFKHSRNRLLDLAGTRCKFNLMLDDSYVVKGDLRKFLEEIRADQYGDSYSLFVKSDDVEYSSNRITRPEKNLRYIYRIHEVIDPENNINVMVPNTVCYLEDRIDKYMTTRTTNRKQWDLDILFQEYNDNPDDPRCLYYIAQTYKCLENWEKTYEFYLHRANHPNQGFLQEKIDAIFEAGRLANFRLNLPWETAEYLYKWAFSLDPKRPDPLYFLGIHYYLQGDKYLGYQYFKQAFELGYPLHAQYSLKPTLSFHYLPKFLTELCYLFQDYITGKKSAQLYLTHNNDQQCQVQQSWYNIFDKLLSYPVVNNNPIVPDKPIIVFCIDGNWNKWTGSDILTKGLGGSETWAVETASYLAETNRYHVYLFCKCSKQETYRSVHYRPIENYLSFINDHFIKACYISRYSCWLPVSYLSTVDSIYLWVHDLTPSEIVIPQSEKLKGIFCLTRWHRQYLQTIFTSLSIKYHYYGINILPDSQRNIILANKISNRFIYSSTANRGLKILLSMWDDIREVLPDASLEIFCDLDLPWASQSDPQGIAECKRIISQGANKGIIYRGWCAKSDLSIGQAQAQYWLYPCIFQETFCLTAWEAINYGVIPITNGLSSLAETASSGLIIPGNPDSQDWKQKVLNSLTVLSNDNSLRDKIIQQGFSSLRSWKHQSEQLELSTL